MYTLLQNISLDESLLMWKDWLKFSQLIASKAAQRGIKSYEICEPQTGYLWRFEIHDRKNTPLQHIDNPQEATTPATVLNLLRGLEPKGYTIRMDNLYHSPCLTRRLKSLGFDYVGTLQNDCKFIPQTLNSLTKRATRPG